MRSKTAEILLIEREEGIGVVDGVSFLALIYITICIALICIIYVYICSEKKSE